MDFAEIIQEVKKENQSRPFRPSLEQLEADDYIIRCIKACWHEDPDQRPDIRFVRLRLKEMQVRLDRCLFVYLSLLSVYVLGRIKAKYF